MMKRRKTKPRHLWVEKTKLGAGRVANYKQVRPGDEEGLIRFWVAVNKRDYLVLSTLEHGLRTRLGSLLFKAAAELIAKDRAAVQKAIRFRRMKVGYDTEGMGPELAESVISMVMELVKERRFIELGELQKKIGGMLSEAELRSVLACLDSAGFCALAEENEDGEEMVLYIGQHCTNYKGRNRKEKKSGD